VKRATKRKDDTFNFARRDECAKAKATWCERESDHIDDTYNFAPTRRVC